MLLLLSLELYSSLVDRYCCCYGAGFLLFVSVVSVVVSVSVSVSVVVVVIVVVVVDDDDDDGGGTVGVIFLPQLNIIIDQ